MSEPKKLVYKVYASSTATGEKCVVTVRPPLERGPLRVAKLALENAEPTLGTPRQDDKTNRTIWQAIPAIGESRLVQTNLTPDDLVRSQGVAMQALHQEGFEVIPVEGIIITQTGLLEL